MKPWNDDFGDPIETSRMMLEPGYDCSFDTAISTLASEAEACWHRGQVGRSAMLRSVVLELESVREKAMEATNAPN